MNYAPIIIFVYNRIDNIKLTIDALLKNIDSSSTEVFIYSDNAKTDDCNTKVEAVRNYIKGIKGFKNLTIIERESNYGLAKNIIAGVSEIIEKYEKVIVLEDDLITSKNFICYMNEALNFYEKNQEVFSISGFTLPLKSLQNYEFDSYLTYRPSSWGWSTWKNRWIDIDWELKDYNDFIKDKHKQKLFNRGGIDMTRMLRHYKEEKNNSWAIRWSYAMYKKEMYSVYPKISKVQNIGFGINATHCKGINIYKTNLDSTYNCKFSFVDQNLLNKKLINQFKYHYSYANKLIKKIIGYVKK